MKGTFSEYTMNDDQIHNNKKKFIEMPTYPRVTEAIVFTSYYVAFWNLVGQSLSGRELHRTL